MTHPERNERTAPWAGLALAPAAWSLYAVAAWAVVPLACRHGVMALLHAAAFTLLAVAVVGLLLAVRVHREAGGGFLAWLGIVLSGYFTLGLAFFVAFNLAVDPCR